MNAELLMKEIMEYLYGRGRGHFMPNVYEQITDMIQSAFDEVIVQAAREQEVHVPSDCAPIDMVKFARHLVCGIPAVPDGERGEIVTDKNH